MLAFLNPAPLARSSQPLQHLPIPAGAHNCTVPVQVMPVELPGHNSRGKEPPITSMKALVEAMATALAPLMSEMPFALFGHSMGAWVVYALAQASRLSYFYILQPPPSQAVAALVPQRSQCSDWAAAT